jgi:hypothetical protein
VDAKAGEGVQLGVGGDLEAAAGGVEASKDPRIRVAFGRVVDGELGQGAGDGAVGTLDCVQVYQQVGRGMVQLGSSAGVSRADRPPSGSSKAVCIASVLLLVGATAGFT